VEWAKCKDCHYEQYMFNEDTTCGWCGGKLSILPKNNKKYYKRYK